MRTRTLETVILLQYKHTHTEQQTTTRARTPKALQRAQSGGLGFSMYRGLEVFISFWAR